MDTQLDLSDIAESLPPSDDGTAKREKKAWEDDYDEQDGAHGLILRRVLFYVACAFIYILALFFLILIGVWFLHLVVADKYRWLNHGEVQAIERILFASTLVSLAGKYFSKFKLVERK